MSNTAIINNNRGLTATALKYIAIAAMLLDHIAWVFSDTVTLFGWTSHFIGRLTAPIMCFFIAEGYYHTKNLSKYMLRLAIFAVISHFPYVMMSSLTEPPLIFESGSVVLNTEMLSPTTSVIFSLLMGLCALSVWKNKKLKMPIKIIAIIILCGAALFADWQFWAVLMVLAFGIFHGDKKKQFIAYYVVAFCAVIYYIAMRDGIFINMLSMSGIFISVYYLIFTSTSSAGSMWIIGIFIPPLLLKNYNGERGGSRSKLNKWIFYWFYPLHMLVLVIIKWYF